MSCEVCGSRCQGRRCAMCEKMASAEDQLVDDESHDCPECGGRTSGRGVVCYKCRGGDDE